MLQTSIDYECERIMTCAKELALFMIEHNIYPEPRRFCAVHDTICDIRKQLNIDRKISQYEWNNYIKYNASYLKNQDIDMFDIMNELSQSDEILICKYSAYITMCNNMMTYHKEIDLLSWWFKYQHEVYILTK